MAVSWIDGGERICAARLRSTHVDGCHTQQHAPTRAVHHTHRCVTHFLPARTWISSSTISWNSTHTLSHRPFTASRLDLASTSTLSEALALALDRIDRLMNQRAAWLVNGCRPPKEVWRCCSGRGRALR